MTPDFNPVVAPNRYRVADVGVLCGGRVGFRAAGDLGSVFRFDKAGFSKANFVSSNNRIPVTPLQIPSPPDVRALAQHGMFN